MFRLPRLYFSNTDLFLPSTPVLSFSIDVFLDNRILQWRHNERDAVSNHQRLNCCFNRLFRRRSKKTSKFHVTGLCEGNPPVTGGFPSQRVSDVEKNPFDDVIASGNKVGTTWWQLSSFNGRPCNFIVHTPEFIFLSIVPCREQGLPQCGKTSQKLRLLSLAETDSRTLRKLRSVSISYR